MLAPKRTKYRKPYRRVAKGLAVRGNLVSFGDFGLQSIQPGWISSYQIESGRRVLTRYVRRGGKLWIRIFPDRSITNRPPETRIGSGKGRPDRWVSVIRKGTMIFELCGISQSTRRQALRITAAKIPIKMRFIRKLIP
jgi:large subunit ribosomal protein L16